MRIGVAMIVLAALATAGCGGGGGAPSPTSSGHTSTLPGPPSSSTPLPTSTSTGTSPAPGGKGRRIVVVFMENHNYADVEGNPCCPFETQLSRRGRLFTNYYGVAYPSKPNYLAFGGGSTFGQAGSDNPLPVIQAPSLFHQLSAAGVSWAGWVEDYPGGPGRCYLQPTGSTYAMRHVAPLLFADVAQTGLCNRISASPPRVLPHFLWVTPNTCNDDHDCSPSVGDRWLAAHVPAWLHRGAEVFITYDTGNPDHTHGGGHVYAVLAGHGVRPRVDARLMSHYSALAGVERAFGLPLLGAARTATPVPFP